MKKDTCPPDSHWMAVQTEVTRFLADYLFKIEWYYGEGQAPFIFPPRYIINKWKEKVLYTCELILDNSRAEKLTLSSPDIRTLPGKVRESIIARFGDIDEKIKDPPGSGPG